MSPTLSKGTYNQLSNRKSLESILKYDQSQTHFQVKSLTKHYPNRMKYFEYDKPFEKRKEGYQLMYKAEKIRKGYGNPKNAAENLARSLRRTKTAISDQIEWNDFTHFITYTFDQKKVDRYDAEAVCKKLLNFMTVVQREAKAQGLPKFEYLIVPEPHKDGALHFHGLFKNYPGELTLNGYKDKGGRPIYTLEHYKLGKHEATVIGNLKATANYCKKYITKELMIQPNKKRYHTSKGLKKPPLTYNDDPQQLATENNGKIDINSAYATSFYTSIDILKPEQATPPL
jgi:hypothetical protein